MNNQNLRKIAMEAKKEFDEKQTNENVKNELLNESSEQETLLNEFEEYASPSEIEGDYEDDDDEAVVFGSTINNDFEETSDEESYEIQEEDSDPDRVSDDELFGDDKFIITDEELNEAMPDIEGEEAKIAYEKIRADIPRYRKDLIVRHGYTIKEADDAARARLKRLGKEENNAYLEENPKIGIVEIDKKNAKKLEFTPAEREKLTRSKVIQLKVVEDQELGEIKIKRVDKKRKTQALQNLDTNLSQYSVPLPLMYDFVKFRGSQIIQLIQAVRYNDTTLDEMISKKASLIYNQLVGGANLEKYDENGKVVMSYQEFTNKFLFHDLDMALYGILIASSMESISTDLTCSDCGQSFTWTYNLKKLLNLDDLTEDFKEKIDDCLGHKFDKSYLQDRFNEENKTSRVKSPVTGNIYDLGYPSIARAINLFQTIDQNDETMIYLSSLALFIDKLYVYDKKSDEYIEIEDDEYRALFEVLQIIPQEEIDIIQNYLKPYVYSPKFILESQCEHCGNKMTNNLSVDDLVFLKARDSSTEIRK